MACLVTLVAGTQIGVKDDSSTARYEMGVSEVWAGTTSIVGEVQLVRNAEDIDELSSAGDAPEPAAEVDSVAEVPLAPGTTVSLTFYVCSGAPPGFQDGYCGTMASGNTVYEGAAACGYGLALGQQFRIAGDSSGQLFTCEDRGLGPWWWIDVFRWDYSEGRAWRHGFGESVAIELV